MVLLQKRKCKENVEVQKFYILTSDEQYISETEMWATYGWNGCNLRTFELNKNNSLGGKLNVRLFLSV